MKSVKGGKIHPDPKILDYDTFLELVNSSVIVPDLDLDIPGAMAYHNSLARSSSRSSNKSWNEQSPRQLFKPTKNQKISRQELYSLRIFIRFCTQLELQLKCNQQPLCRILNAFINSVFERSLSRSQSPKQELQALKQQLLSFTTSFQVAVLQFYELSHILNEQADQLYFTYENMSNLILTQLFRQPKVYSLADNVLEKITSVQDQRFSALCKLPRNAHLRPQFFGVPRDYCLQLSKYPYDSSVSCLSRIAQIKSPMGKLKCILNACELIPTCISEYLNQVQKREQQVLRMSSLHQQKPVQKIRSVSFSQLANNKSKQQQIDADGMLSIVSFVAYRCGREGLQLQKQLSLIEQFVCPSFMSGMGGYYWSVLQGSLSHLLNILNQ